MLACCACAERSPGAQAGVLSTMSILGDFMSILVSFLRRLWSAGESSPPLRVLHRSPHFLVVEKPPDLVLNSDDPGRDSLHLRMAEQFKKLADFGKYKVRMGPAGMVSVYQFQFRQF